MGFFSQEYQSGLPCPPPGYLPNPGIKPRSPGCIAGRFFTAEPLVKPSDQHLVLFCSNEHLFREQQGKLGQKYNLFLSHQYSHCQIFTP